MFKTDPIDAPQPNENAIKHLVYYYPMEDCYRAGFVGTKEDLISAGVASETMFPSCRSHTKSRERNKWRVNRVSASLGTWEVDRSDELVQALRYDNDASREARRHAPYVAVEAPEPNAMAASLVVKYSPGLSRYWCHFEGSREELIAAGVACDEMFPVKPLLQKHSAIDWGSSDGDWRVKTKRGKYIVTRWGGFDLSVLGISNREETPKPSTAPRKNHLRLVVDNTNRL